MEELAPATPVTNYQSPTTNYQSPTTNYQSPTTNYKSPINLKERTFGGAGTCDAWYKNSEGYNWTLWPADCITYWSVLIILLLIFHLSLKTISTCNCLQLTFTAILTQSFSQTLQCNILLSHPFSEVIGSMQ